MSCVPDSDTLQDLGPASGSCIQSRTRQVFRFQEADGACSVYFECPVCQIKMDIACDAVPAKGGEFDCPNCQAQLIVHYAQDEHS